jgi:hypothetical protein
MSQPRERQGAGDRGAGRTVRFEATIHAGRTRNFDRLIELDIDRVPDPKGQIRALLSAEDCVRLLEEGFEVRLHHAHPIRPLDPRLIETDESVRRQLDERLRGLERAPGPEGPGRPGRN